MTRTALCQSTANRQPRGLFSGNPQNGDKVVRFECFSFCSIWIDRITYNHDVVIDRGEVWKPGLLPVRVNVLSHRSVLIVGHQLPKATRTHTGYRMSDTQITRHLAFVQKGKTVRLTLKDTKRVLKLPAKGVSLLKW